MQRKLDLRAGRPVWFAYRAPSVPAGKLTHDIKTDVLVIGMGISGAMIAEALTAAGLDVVCIDRRGPLKGSTPATTALVQFEIDVPLTRLANMIGLADAERAWRRSRLAVSNLAGRIAELGISCDVRHTGSLYLAGNALGAGELREEAEARGRAGIRGTYLTASQLRDTFGMERDGAIRSGENLSLDPRKLTAGLFARALERKARFYAPVEATGMEDGRDEVVVHTSRGPTITAAHVVLATGYELMNMVPSSTHSIISTFAIATRPQKAAIWPGAPFIWEASDPYLYARATPDGRVICGGEDEDFSDEARRNDLLPAKAARIAAKLKALFPRLDTTPEFAWTGSFGTTTTGLPYMGAITGHPRVFAALGYGGNGITFSQIASELISTAIAGDKDTDASLFAFGRTGPVRKIADLAGRLIG